jgi:hypothetical protein
MVNLGGCNASGSLDDAISADESEICICKCSSDHAPAAASNTAPTKLQCVCAAGILQQLICFDQQFHEHEQFQPWF